MKKACTVCGIEKEEEEFSFRDKNAATRRTDCKDCFSRLTKSHYQNNKESYQLKQKIRIQAGKDLNLALKEGLKCVVCGEARWWVLDFHHRDPAIKSFGISEAIRKRGDKFIDLIKEEIKKCDVLCANCHRDHHHQERLK